MNKELEKFKGKYIGPYLIDFILETENKTYLGKPKVKVVFAVKLNEDELHPGAIIKPMEDTEYPLSAMDYIVTDEKSDLTTLRESRVTPVVKELLVVLAEADLTLEDASYALMVKAKMSLDDSVNRASKILWGKEPYDVTLMDLEKVLKSKL